jgi:hypothetical protein
MIGTYPTSKAWGVTIREKLLEISEYFTIPTILFPSSNDDDLGIVGIVKKNQKKKKIRFYLPPMLLRSGLREKPILLNILQYNSFNIQIQSHSIE